MTPDSPVPERTNKPEPEIAPVAAHSCKITCTQEKNWWDRWKPYLEMGGIFLLAIYTGYTIRIYHANHDAATAAQSTLGEIQKQSTLMRQQLVGTMAAIVILQEPRITNDPITNKETIVFQLLNQGHVIAPEAHLAFEIETVSFPQLETIYQSQNYTVAVQQVAVGGGWSKRYALQDFSVQELQFPSQRKTITVRGKFGFDNGFGDKIPDQDFCFSYIGAYNTRNEDGGSTNGGGGFSPCDQFKDTVSYVSTHQLK